MATLPSQEPSGLAGVEPPARLTHLATSGRVRSDLFGLLARSERNGVPMTSALAGLASRPDPEETPMTRQLSRLGVAAGVCLLLALASTWVGLVAAVVLLLVALEYGYAASRLRHLGHLLYACVTRGMTLSDAMATYSSQFLPYEIAVVRAGERAGRLAPALEFLERFTLARRGAMLRFVRSLVYPAVMLPIAGFLMFSVVVFVSPKFFAIIMELGGELPPGAQIVRSLSQDIQNGWLGFMLLPVLPCLAAYLLFRRSAWRLVERLPWLGEPVRWGAQGRFLFVLGHLLESRVPAVEAIAMAASASGSTRQWQAAMRASGRIAGGQPLLDSLEAEGCLPTRVAVQLRLVADRTPGFEEKCMTLGSDLLETQSNWFVRLAQVVEPVVVMCMVVATGLFIVSIYMTIFGIPMTLMAASRF